MHNVLLALWFFAPAGVANMMPVFVAKMPVLKNWNAPMDGGKSYRGIRIFGSHKTWRGFIAGIIFATITLGIQQVLVIHQPWAANFTKSISYRTLPTLVVGPLFGIGALGADAIESFFKRQRRIPPGHGWFPFDQSDYVVGGALATAPYVRLSIMEYVWLLVLWLAASLLASYIGFKLGFKERPI
ncbi:MAG TPA: CDP-archaeol synthase [Candidatus Saccharimonadales bacterium]